MRPVIRAFDAWLRRAEGVFEFTDDPACVLRLQVARAPHDLGLGDRCVRAGEPVLVLHLWNEHLPPLPAAGPDLAWARRAQRLFVTSLRVAADCARRDPHLARARAVGGITPMLSHDDRAAGARVIERLGFTVSPFHHPLGRFGEFWENFYSWWLMWAFSPASLRSRTFRGMQRVEMWMLAEDFLRRFADG